MITLFNVKGLRHNLFLKLPIHIQNFQFFIFYLQFMSSFNLKFSLPIHKYMENMLRLRGFTVIIDFLYKKHEQNIESEQKR